jgi:hypothetical protein
MAKELDAGWLVSASPNGYVTEAGWIRWCIHFIANCRSRPELRAPAIFLFMDG